MKTVLFLCSGNYYRSRFAEIYFNWHARQRELTWQAASRGLALDPFNAGTMSSHTIAWLARRGISIEPYHRAPLDVTAEDFSTADHIVAVKRTEHWALMQSRFPDWLDRVEYWEVHDLDFARPDVTIPHLEREIHDLSHRLANAARTG
jgi:protein-tyrosine phosphatase